MWGAAASLKQPRPADRPHHRLHPPAPGLRQEHPRQPGGAFPSRRAAHRGRRAARPHLPVPASCTSRARTSRKLASMAKLKCGPPEPRGGRQLPAVLGRHGLHARQPDLAGLPRLAPDLHRRRRRRGDAGHHLQARGHVAQGRALDDSPHAPGVAASRAESPHRLGWGPSRCPASLENASWPRARTTLRRARRRAA